MWRLPIAVVYALALGSIAHAQDGLRSASLPERPIATQPPGPGDRFRAGPETYVPHPRGDRGWPGAPHGRGANPLSGYGVWWPDVPRPQTRRSDEDRFTGAWRNLPPPTGTDRQVNTTVPAPAPAPVPAPPAPRRTFYVIPLCYAGDKPPDPSIACDRTKLRTIR